jgi:putative heme iron utilization protein
MRWFKYDYELIEELKKNCSTPEEFREFADKAIMDGVSPAQMHRSIQDSMHHKMVRIWFSGETCNVERNLSKFHDALLRGAAKAVTDIAVSVMEQLSKAEFDAGVR